MARQDSETLLLGYPEGTIEVPIRPSPDYDWQNGNWVFLPSAPVRSMIAKSVVQERIIAAGKMAEAYVALTSNPIYFARWFAPDHPVVYCDDPDAIMLVTAIGLDPAAILEP